MRKKISAELKAKVAIESIKGLKTISEIASMYEVHPNQVSIWKKQYIESAVSIFSKPNPAENQEKEQQIEALYRKIGQLEMDNDFLSGRKYRANDASFNDRAWPSGVEFGSSMHLVEFESQRSLL